MHKTLTHIIYKIKLQFLTVCLFFCSVVSFAQIKYWVGVDIKQKMREVVLRF